MTMENPVILLTTDFSEEAERAYEKTVSLARRLGGRIVLAHVVEVAAVAPHGSPLAPTQFPPDTPKAVDEAREQLKKEAEKLGSDVPVELVAEAAADVVDRLTKIAHDKHVDVIAISTHGRTGLRRLVLGSVAEAVVRHSPVPVLCFPKS